MAIERASEYLPDGPEQTPGDRLLPTERSKEDFPVGMEVIVYAMRHGQRELGWGCVEGHSDYGSVIVRPYSKQRGLPVPRSRQKEDPAAKEVVKMRPSDPGLIREEEFLRLREDPGRITAWAEATGFYKPAEATRLASKIGAFTGYEGRPWASLSPPVVRERPKGIRRLSQER